MNLLKVNFPDHLIYDCCDKNRDEIVDIITSYSIPTLIIVVQRTEYNFDFFKGLAMKRNVSRYIGFYCQCGNLTYYGTNLTEKGILQFKTAIYDAYSF